MCPLKVTQNIWMAQQDHPNVLSAHLFLISIFVIKSFGPCFEYTVSPWCVGYLGLGGGWGAGGQLTQVIPTTSTRTQFPQNFVHKKGRLYRDLMAWTLYKYMFATQGNHADIFMLHLLYKQNSVIIVFHTVYQLTVVLYCDRWELRGLQLIHHMAPAQVSTKPISTWYPFGNN